MVKYCDLAICDSVNIEKYIHESCLTKKAYGTQPGHTQFYYPKKYGYGELWLRMADSIKGQIEYGRRAILQQFIKEIRVRKDYEISIALNASFNQVEQLKAVSTYDGAEIFEEISEKGA